MCISGGAALPVEVLRGFEKAFGCIILEGYGLSETSPVASFNHPHKERKATAATIRDGWLSTGDQARMDEDGHFFIVDRKKDLIIRGGYNVYPREVEEVLYEHPAVAEAAVIGIPDALLGEEICAAVGLKAGASASPEELIAFVKERLAAYKYPRQIWIVDTLPKTATGKILRREVAPPPAVPAS